MQLLLILFLTRVSEWIRFVRFVAGLDSYATQGKHIPTLGEIKHE